MTAADLRAMLAADHLTHVPGVWDPASAALAVRAGHRAVHLSGQAIAATMLGRPDLGYTPATQIADRATTLVPALEGVPLLADADIGYDSRNDAVWTALSYQRAGISGLVLADGQDAGQSADRIAALVAQVPGIVLVARVRGRGLADTIERCRAYAGAGADAVLPEDISEADDLGRLRAALPAVPLAVNRSETASGRGRLTGAELAGSGVRLVLHPLAAVLAALRAASLTYRTIADEGDAGDVDRMPPAALATVSERPALRATGSNRPAGRATGSDRPAAVTPGIDKIDT